MSLTHTEKLAEIEASRPTLQWSKYGHITRAYGSQFDVTLPHQCKNTGNFLVTDEGGLRPSFIRVGWLRVPSELRGSGIGKRLTQSLGALARSYDSDHIETHLRSQYSFDILSSVYGDERLKFWDDRDPGEQAIDHDVVREALVAAQQKEKNLEFRRFGFTTRIDLIGLDTTGWELPLDQARAEANAAAQHPVSSSSATI
jgi:hypothetical protein